MRELASDLSSTVRETTDEQVVSKCTHDEITADRFTESCSSLYRLRDTEPW
jgi:hypothetical protein